MSIDSDARTRLIYGFLSAGLVVLIWSGFNIVSRMGGRSVLTPFDLGAIRCSVASIFMLPFFLRRPRAVPLRQLLALAAFGGIGYALFVYSGFALAPAAHAAVIVNGGIPFATALVAWLLLGYRPGRRTQLALMLTAAGIALIGWQSMSFAATAAPHQWLGDLCYLCAALCWGAYGILLRHWNIRPLDALAGLVVASAALYLPIYGLLLPKALAAAPASMLWLQVGYQGVAAAVVAGLLFAYANQTIGPMRASLMLALVPGISAIAAIPLLDEPLYPATICGLVLVTAGAIAGATAQAASKR